ncbi:MAG: transcriptional regulator [Streptosporangiales bacterium]|nr:transcriptional regulator [Streptosporangiales bacterium]
MAGTLDVVGDRWSLLIVRDLLFGGQLRYGELAASEEGIPTNVLAARLRRLVDAGIVAREQYSERPPRHAYRLTERRRALGPVLDALGTWGVDHLPNTRRLYG